MVGHFLKPKGGGKGRVSGVVRLRMGENRWR